MHLMFFFKYFIFHLDSNVNRQVAIIQADPIMKITMMTTHPRLKVNQTSHIHPIPAINPNNPNRNSSARSAVISQTKKIKNPLAPKHWTSCHTPISRYSSICSRWANRVISYHHLILAHQLPPVIQPVLHHHCCRLPLIF